MASLGLKLYYLRTREKKVSQRDVAETLGIRQATVSNLEQEVTSPHWALLVDLCRFYDVTPTFLADDARGVVPRMTERWGLRDSLLTMGMWIETDPDSWQPSANGKSLCRIEPGSRFFDDEAARVQLRDQRRGDGGGGGDRDGGGGGAGDGDGGGDGDGDGRNALLELHDRDRTEASQLEEQLRHELSEHPRRRSRKRPED